MTEPYYSDNHVTLWHGDALDVLRDMPDGSVDICVTSPPYFGLRDYEQAGQYGLESSPAEYVERMRQVFAEVRRVLADDGTLWLNLGDSYYSGRGNPGPNADDRKQVARRGWVRPVDRPGQEWAKPKDLLGIPWRVAFAELQDKERASRTPSPNSPATPPNASSTSFPSTRHGSCSNGGWRCSARSTRRKTR
ncbi:DNA methyltransferase, partial [Saccharomonospora viridis]|uniref:DNA methyltransferase n=1 Tax=Saccharomonospora viridis TaxID=1852 RepID=UPI0023F45BCD